jgi:stress-induced morphogen
MDNSKILSTILKLLGKKMNIVSVSILNSRDDTHYHIQIISKDLNDKVLSRVDKTINTLLETEEGKKFFMKYDLVFDLLTPEEDAKWNGRLA